MNKRKLYFRPILFVFIGFFIISLLVFLLTNYLSDDKIIVNVDLQSSHSYLEGKKVYFGNQATRVFLDSAIVKDGKFGFSINLEDDFMPFEACLLYATGNKNYPFWLLGFKNPYKDKTYMPYFYADRGKMNFVINTSSKVHKKEVIDLIFLNINKQTQVFYKLFSFRHKSGTKDKDYNAELIRKFPTSVYLLRQLNTQKSNIQDAELNELVSLFDKSVHKSAVYQQLIAHINYQNENGSDFPSKVVLFHPDTSRVSSIIDPNKYNLIVFWASWCGPCRKEIPQIRNLFEANRNKLNIVNISIDKNRDAWKRALSQEQMSWPQMLLRRDSSYVKFDKKYNLTTIPVWVLFDSKGQFITQHIGLEQGKNAIDQKVAQLINKL